MEEKILINDFAEEIVEKHSDMPIAICTIIKNEHRYLDEWIQYHLNMGFDKIYLYEDIGSDSHNEITDKYDNVYLDKFRFSDAELPHHIPTFGVYKQMYLWEWFIHTHSEEVGWCLFSDVDEFLEIKSGKTLRETIEDNEGKYGIKIYWDHYDADGNVYYEDKPVLERFNRRVDVSNNNYKTFVNLKFPCTMFYNAHLYIGSEECDTMVLKHYYTKSWEEFCEKLLLRGDVFMKNRKLNSFFDYNPDLFDRKDELMELCKKWESEGKFNNDNNLYLENNHHYSDDDNIILLSNAYYCSKFMNKKLFIDESFLNTENTLMLDVYSMFETYSVLPEKYTVLTENGDKNFYIEGNVLLRYDELDLDKCDFEFFGSSYEYMFNQYYDELRLTYSDIQDICLVSLFNNGNYVEKDINKYLEYFDSECDDYVIYVYGNDEKLFNEIFKGIENARFHYTNSMLDSLCIGLDRRFSPMICTQDKISKVTEKAKYTAYFTYDTKTKFF